MSQVFMSSAGQPLPPSTFPGRYESLDGLRGALALGVVFHHYFLFSSFRWFSNAWVAVDVFFLMSGLVLASAYHAKLLGGMSAGTFFRQRLLRLYPLYLVSFLYATFVYWLRGGDEAILIAMGVFLVPALNGVQNAAHGQSVVFPINDPSWSLFFEIWGGLVFAALYRVLQPRRRLLLVTAILFVCYLFVVVDVSVSAGWSPESFIGGLFRVLFFMMLGRIIWEFRSAIPGLSPRTWLTLLIVFLLTTSVRSIYCVPFLLFLGVALVASGIRLGGMLTGRWRALSLYLGRISYALYLVHYPTWSLVAHLVREGSNGERIVLSTLFSLILAESVTRFDELIRHRIGRIGLVY